MPRFYQPDLGTEPDSPFARDANNKLVRRGYWLDMNDRSLVLVMTQGIGAHLTNDEKLAHLTDLKREHLVDQVCIQEILPPDRKVRNAASMQWHFCNSHLKCHGVAQKSKFLTQIKLRCQVVGNAAEAFDVRSMCGSDLVGNPMKSAIAAHLPDEHFVIRVDGRVKSHHRRFWMR